MSAVISRRAREPWQDQVDEAVECLRNDPAHALALAESLRNLGSDKPVAVLFGRTLELLVPLFREDTSREAELMPLLEQCEALNAWDCAALTGIAIMLGMRVRDQRQARWNFACEHMVGYIDRCEPSPCRVMAMNSMGVCAADSGNVDQAARWYYAALDEAQALRLPAREAHIRTNIAELLYLCGNAEEARTMVARAVELAQANGGGWIRLYTRTIFALCCLALNDPAAGVAAVEPMFEIPEEAWSQSPLSRAFFLAASALVLTDVGQLERAGRYVARAAVLVEGQIERQFSPYVWWARGHWLRACGDTDGAIAELHHALDTYDTAGWVFLPMRVAHEIYSIHRSRGEHMQALAMHERYHAWYDQVQSQSTRTRLQVLRNEHTVKILEADAQRQREVSAMKSRFIAMASHEFRTPLAAVQSSAELLRFYYERMDQAERERVLSDLQHGVDRLKTTMEQVLLLAKGDAGKLPVSKEHFDWQQAAHDLVKHMGRATGERNPIELLPIDEATSELNPLLDRRLFEQALSNLIGNACKYSDPGQRVQVRFRRSGMQLIMEVQDHGIGIPEADQARLFESFERGSNALDIQGTGLGLAIVRHAAHAHDAQISFESKAGAGSTFRIAFPC